MQLYPTMEQLAQLLDEAIDAEHRAICARLIDAEARYSRLHALGRSLAFAAHNALRHGDVVNSSKQPLINALHQWEQNQ